MASNYNRNCCPGMIMVHEGSATELAQRETYLDLTRLDLPFNG